MENVGVGKEKKFGTVGFWGHFYHQFYEQYEIASSKY